MILLFFTFFAPAGNSPKIISPGQRDRLNKHFAIKEYGIEVLANSTWNSGYGNLTGLTEPYLGPSKQPWSIIPSSVEDSAFRLQKLTAKNNNEDSNANDKTYFKNVSASLEGTWARDTSVNITHPIRMPIPELQEWTVEEYQLISQQNHDNISVADADLNIEKVGNYSYDKGIIKLAMAEYLPSDVFRDYDYYNETQAVHKYSHNVSLVKLDMSLTTMDNDVGDDFFLVGVRMRDTGNFVASTNSLKFAGRLALPHFLLEEKWFESAKEFLIHYNNRTLQIESSDPFYGIVEEAEVNAEMCEFIAFGHIHSLDLSKDDLKDIEDEFANPMGRPHKPVPPIKADMLLYSPDCGIVYKSEELTGEKYEQFYRRERTVIMWGIILLLAQTLVTAMQMKDTTTFSTISRVSFYSIALMALADGTVFLVALFSTLIEQTALPFLAMASVAFALSGCFEMRYMILIYQSQLMESVADARASEVSQGSFVARFDGSLGLTQNSENTTNAPTTTNNNNNNNNVLPITETTSPVPTDTLDERQIHGLVVSRYIAFVLLILTVSTTTPLWPRKMRIVYQYVMILALFSFWAPQVYRNVMRGSRKSFLWKYILSTSFVRVVPLLYFTLLHENALNTSSYDPILALAVVSWVALQIFVLFLQTLFGPRFFVPKGWLPELYDYHPIITQDELEDGLTLDGEVVSGGAPEISSITDASSLMETNPMLSSDSRSIDCAICMMPVDLVILPRNANLSQALTPSLIMARQQYMVTPCKHVFHTECMDQWMRSRLQCPVCRNPLPPI